MGGYYEKLCFNYLFPLILYFHVRNGCFQVIQYKMQLASIIQAIVSQIQMEEILYNMLKSRTSFLRKKLDSDRNCSASCNQFQSKTPNAQSLAESYSTHTKLKAVVSSN